MDDKTLILHLLNAEEITYQSKITFDTPIDVYCTNEKITLNKWNVKKKAQKISLKTFKKLLQFNVIELTSGNFGNLEKHYQIINMGNRLKILKECIMRTTNTEFETIFKDILLKCERKLKLENIHEFGRKRQKIKKWK